MRLRSIRDGSVRDGHSSASIPASVGVKDGQEPRLFFFVLRRLASPRQVSAALR